MFCFQSCLSESLYQQVHHGKFASSLSPGYHQFIGVKEKSIDLFVLDEKNPKMNCFKIKEKDFFFKIKGSAILKRQNISSDAKFHDLIVLSLENETVLVLEFNQSKEDFAIITYFELSSLNSNKPPIEKVGDRIKIIDNLILVCSYYRHVEVLKYEDFPPELVRKTPITVNQFISDLDFCPENSTLYILCHDQAINGQINMHIQFFNKDHDTFKHETYLDNSDLIPENISYKILAHIPNSCLTVSPIDGLMEWDAFSLKNTACHSIGLETVVDMYTVNESIILFLDDNSCLWFENKEKLTTPTKLQIGTNQKVINWSVFKADNGFTYAFLNGHTGLEFYKFKIEDSYIERIECILKQNSFSNVVDSQFFPFAPIDQTIVSLSLKPESVDYNIWDSLSETYHGGKLINMVSQSLKLPIIPIKSWLLKVSSSVNLVLLQTLQEVYVLSLKNFQQEDFHVKLQPLSEVLPDTKIINLHYAIGLNENYGILVCPSEVYLLDLQKFEVKSLGSTGKIEASAYFSEKENFHLLFKIKDKVVHYILNQQNTPELREDSRIDVSLQISHMSCFSNNSEHYLITFTYGGVMSIYDLKNHTKVFETELDHAANSAFIFNQKLVIGDRRGNLLLYNLIGSADSGFGLNLEVSYNLGEEKVSLKPLGKSEGLFIYSESLFFLKFDDKQATPFPVKYNDPLSIEIFHVLDETGPHVLVIDKGEIRLFLADLIKTYRKIDFPLDNYLDNFKILKNDPDQIRRILVDPSTSTINLITRNLHIITCDKIGRIISVRTLPNKKNTNNSFLVNAKTSSITLDDELVSFFIISFQNSNNFYLNFYTVEKTLNLNEDNSQSPVRIRKFGLSDIQFNENITDAVIIDHEKMMVASVGTTLLLYSLEPKEKDEETCLAFKQKGSKIFRYNLIQMETLDDLVIVSDQSYGVNILKLDKVSLGESLGYKWEFNICCVIPNKMPCDSLFLSKEEYLVINKLGELSVRNNRFLDYFNHCLDYCQGYVGDMCRRMLPKSSSKAEKTPEVFIPGLKGGIFKVKKISQNHDKNVVYTLKFIESCYKEILLYGDCLDVPNKLGMKADCLMFDWNVFSLLKKEPEAARIHILSRCLSLLPEERRVPLPDLVKLLDKFS